MSNSNRSSLLQSPRLSTQSQRTNASVITQIYNPQAETNATQDDFALDPEGAQPWQAQQGWEFLPPRSTKSPTSPSTPNFSRPFGARAVDGQPKLGTQSEEPYLEDHPEQEDYFGQPTNHSSAEQSNGASQSSTPPAQAGTKKTSSRKGKYSSRSIYSYSGSETSSKARTETSSGSETPLLPRDQRPASQPQSQISPATTHRLQQQHPAVKPADLKPPYDPRIDIQRFSQSNHNRRELESWQKPPEASHSTRPQPDRSRTEAFPPQPLRSGIEIISKPHQNSTRPASTAFVERPRFSKETPRQSTDEPTLDIDALNDDDEITALPAIPSRRPASILSAAEPPPMIRDGRMLDGRKRLLSSSSSSSSSSIPSVPNPPEHRTPMNAWPEVRRPIQERPEMPGRRWSASNYDTSSLSPEKIAKLKKRGINPALWLEMKSAQKKKGRFGLPPLVGNTFLGA